MLGAIAVEHALAALAVFALGCAVGSFLNVCIWRMPRGLSIVQPSRSFCPRCCTSILWHDNIPLLSFLQLHGRCRYCGGRISWRYFVVEALTGVLLAAIYVSQAVVFGAAHGEVIVMCLLTTLLVVGSAIDMDFLIIPDEISYFGIIGALAAGALVPAMHVGAESHHTFESLTGTPAVDGLVASLIGGAAGGVMVVGAAMLGAAIFRKEAMGLGDAKLMAMVGAFMGWKVVVVAFFVAPFFGLLYGVPLLLRKKQHVMPYGPFLSMATVLVILLRPLFCDYVTAMAEMAGEVAKYALGR